MIEKCLVFTVGGACAPIVNAIKCCNPDFVYFICSEGPNGSRTLVDGPGTPCTGDKPDRLLPSIVAQTRLDRQKYRIFTLKNPDDLDECYGVCQEVEKDIQSQTQQPGHKIHVVANYTGGTKTMSSALVLYAIHRRWELQCNVGPRRDLIKVRVGDNPARVSTARVLMDQHITMLETLVKGYHFAEAAEYLTQLLIRGEIPKEKQRTIGTCHNLCLAYNAWDRFEHGEARDLLEPHARHCPKHFVFLKRIVGEIKDHTGYEKVEDLLYNAERRAIQKRYDDAVGRLYRAVEMLAQTRLRQSHQIDTSDVDITKIPEAWRKDYSGFTTEDGKVKIGLYQAYQLLIHLQDPLGSLFDEKRKPIVNALSKRNFSILAHGTQPIDESAYGEVAGVLTDFLTKGLQCVGHKTKLDLQMPTTLAHVFDEPHS